MPTTYEKIATTTLGSANSTITFSSISSAYTDLRLVFNGSPVSSTYLKMQFNSDTATNYSWTYLSGSGSAANSGSGTSSTFILAAAQSSSSSAYPSLSSIDIFSYAGSTFKTVLTSYAGDYNGSGLVNANVSLWRSTSAINTITIFYNTGNIAASSTATLYGILKA